MRIREVKMSCNQASAAALLALVLTSPMLLAATGEAASAPTGTATAQPALEVGNTDPPDPGSEELLIDAGARQNVDTTGSEGARNSNDGQSVTSAMESFTPTEEISADNAVPFPVDI